MMKIIEGTRRKEKERRGGKEDGRKMEEEGCGTENRRLVEMEGSFLFCSVPLGRGPAYSGPNSGPMC